MAITDIAVSQDNYHNNYAVVACHSPLVYKAQATHDGTAPDELAVTVAFDGNGDTCLEFDGSTSFMYTGLFGSELSGAFSMLVWVKTSNLTDDMAVISNLNESTNLGVEIHLVAGVITFTYWDGSAFSSITCTAVTADTWTHIGITYDGSGSIQIYQNGVLCGSSSDTITINSQSFLVGQRRYEQSYFYEGYIDDVYFYSRELTAAEVLSAYNNAPILDTDDGFECGYNFNYSVVPGESNLFGTLIDLTSNHLATLVGTFVWQEGAAYEAATDTTTYEYRCIPVQDVSSTVREFSFRADKVLKFLLGDLDDTLEQSENTTVFMENMATRLILYFHDPDEEYTTGAYCLATIANAAQQWGERANLYDVIRITSTQTIYAPRNFFTYLYGYSSGVGSAHVVYKDGVHVLDEYLTDLGYHRFKTDQLTDGAVYNIAFDSSNYHVIVKMYSECTNSKVIKFLDTDGYYKMVAFSSDYEENSSPKSIGSINKTLSGLLYDMSDSSNIGYKVNRTLRLVQNFDEDQLEYIKGLYESPRVYLYNNDINTTSLSDTAADWTEVTLTSSKPVRRMKNKTGVVEVTVTLPEHYSQTML